MNLAPRSNTAARLLEALQALHIEPTAAYGQQQHWCLTVPIQSITGAYSLGSQLGPEYGAVEIFQGPTGPCLLFTEARVQAAPEGQRMNPRNAYQVAADTAWQIYEFPAGVEVVDTSGWEYTQPGNEWSRKIFVDNDQRDDCGTATTKLTFTVRFATGGTGVLDAYAIDDKGQIWGHRRTLAQDIANRLDIRTCKCSASLDEGLLTLEDGNTINLGAIQDYLRRTASMTIPGSNDEENTMLVDLVEGADTVLASSGLKDAAC